MHRYLKRKQTLSIIRQIKSIGNYFLACACNKFGSIRPDCSQEDGRCFCKPGVSGPKCTICPDNMELKEDGCVSGIFNYSKNKQNNIR